MQNPSVTILAGHYGSGKTEFAIAYAKRLCENGLQVSIGDLDVVNPFYRTREQRGALEALGLAVHASNFPGDNHIDAPALSAALGGLFAPEEGSASVIDVGGDPAGARVLARYRDRTRDGGYDLWLVVNANRPRTDTAAKAAEFIGEIEATSGFRATGLVGNTHMLRDTSADDILRGDALLRELSVLTGLPVKYITLPLDLAGDPRLKDLSGEPFPLTPVLRQTWL